MQKNTFIIQVRKLLYFIIIYKIHKNKIKFDKVIFWNYLKIFIIKLLIQSWFYPSLNHSEKKNIFL